MHYRQFGLKLMYMLFSTGFTIVMVPYNGLLPDMVDDYTVRAKFSSVRMMFSAFGAILAGLVPTLMIRDNTNAGQYLTVALIFGVIFLVVILITFFGTFFLTHYVSLGSLLIYVGILIEVPILGQMGHFHMTQPHLNELYLIALFLAVMTFIRHKDNIRRLLSGTERKTYLGHHEDKANNGKEKAGSGNEKSR